MGNTTVCVGDGLGYILCQIHTILNSVIPVLIALGVVFFIWGVVLYVIGGGEEAKKKGRDKIIYGIIGLSVIIGLWGLVRIVVTTFGLGSYAPALAPLVGVDPSWGLLGNPTLQDILC